MSRPVDLPRVRRALAELDRIAAEHPELCQGEGHWNEKEVQRIMGTPAKDRVRAYRTRLLEQGNTRLSIFLTPDASAVLTTLRTRYPDKSINDIISSVLTGGIPIAPPQDTTP